MPREQRCLSPGRISCYGRRFTAILCLPFGHLVRPLLTGLIQDKRGNGKCHEFAELTGIQTAILSGLTDLMIMGLIYPILKKLKIDFKRKLILFGLFSLGIFSLICNVVRTVLMLEPPFTSAYAWATAEITVAIICASIPTIRPLFDKKSWIKSSGERTLTRLTWENDSGWFKTIHSDRTTVRSIPSTVNTRESNRYDVRNMS